MGGSSERGSGLAEMPGVMPLRLWDSGPKAALLGHLRSPTAGNRCVARHQGHCLCSFPNLFPFPRLVPTRYGVVLGAVIGGVLGAVLLALVLFYLIRYCWLRRQAALQRRLR